VLVLRKVLGARSRCERPAAMKLGGWLLSATLAFSMASVGRQWSWAASAGESGVSVPFTFCEAQPTFMYSALLWPSSRWENQSWVMNWIQNAASTLKNGAFL